MIRVIMARIAHLLPVACILVGISHAAAIAQTGLPSSELVPRDKVQELIKLIGDPEVRAWLETKPAPPADPSATAASQIAVWEDAIRNDLAALRNAFARLPGEAANAVRIVRWEINNHRFATILGLFGILLGLAFGAEWLFKQATGGGRQLDFAQAPGASRAPNGGRAVRVYAELAPLVVSPLSVPARSWLSIGPPCCASSS